MQVLVRQASEVCVVDVGPPLGIADCGDGRQNSP